jgi:hypothetical protein
MILPDDDETDIPVCLHTEDKDEDGEEEEKRDKVRVRKRKSMFAVRIRLFNTSLDTQNELFDSFSFPRL